MTTFEWLEIKELLVVLQHEKYTLFTTINK